MHRRRFIHAFTVRGWPCPWQRWHLPTCWIGQFLISEWESSISDWIFAATYHGNGKSKEILKLIAKNGLSGAGSLWERNQLCEHQKIGVEMKTCFAVFLNLPTQHVLQHSAVNSILHSGQMSGVFLISTTEKMEKRISILTEGNLDLVTFCLFFMTGTGWTI